jgi:tetratricopeptide (TPR) repeat protein
MLLPLNLAVFYPPRNHLNIVTIVLCAVVFSVISYSSVRSRKKHPYILFGWLWYCITLLPVIGIIQVGDQSMADRYTYIPSIGLFIIAVWGIYDLSRHLQHYGRPIVIGLAITILTAYLILTYKEMSYWKNSQTLFEHALAVTTDNYVAHNNLGLYYAGQGNTQAALKHYSEALRLHDNNVIAHNNIGNLLMELGQTDSAISHYNKAILLKPGYAEAHNNLGIAFAQQNKLHDAVHEFQKALQFNPDNVRPYNNIGLALMKLNENTAAIPYLLHAVALDTNNAEAHYNLGCAYATTGDTVRALPHWEAAQRIDPGYSR